MPEILDYKDDESATLRPTCCPTCGQECDTPIVKGNVWAELVRYVAAAVEAAQGKPVDVEKLCQQLEKRLGKQERVELKKRSTYRVSKWLLVQAVNAGIPLLRPNGLPKGRTQLGKELPRVH
jgi:hypothetical protein